MTVDCRGGCGCLIVQSGGRGRPKLWCSRQCRERHRGRRRPDRRRGSRYRLRACEVCSAEYRPTYTGQRTCGRACGVELRRRITGTLPADVGVLACAVYFRNCDECRRLFAARRSTQKRCSAECRRVASSRVAAAAIMRRYYSDPAFRASVIAAARVRSQKLISYLMVRDRGRCGLCRKRVRDKSGPFGPSVDHIIPRSLGGDLHDRANLQLAHLVCNIRKGNRGGGEQLLLVG